VKNPWKVVENVVYEVYWLPFPCVQATAHGDQNVDGEGEGRPQLVISDAQCLREELTKLCSWRY